MRLLFVADGRSPIALNWIGYFTHAGHEVHLVSTFNCDPKLALASLHVLPVAFSDLRGVDTYKAPRRSLAGSLLKGVPVGLRTSLRQRLGPFTFQRAARRLAQIIGDVQPELVHAMRIPFEGMVASLALAELPGKPFVISIWGNDFTLHAASTEMLGRYTRQALSRADALHTDCHRDARLARKWGYAEAKPVYVLPGSGGVKRDIFFPPAQREQGAPGELLVVNPRGMRAYVRNDTFFKAIPVAVRKNPSLRFACTSMKAEPQAERWIKVLEIENYVNLLPRLEHADMAPLFRQAQIVVSPSEHDGTPNTLLEAMACGSFPIAGDLESLREWIIPGVNGLLFDPDDPEDLAQAILTAASRVDLRKAAEEYNLRLVSERAEYSQVMASAADFYRQLSASSAASNWLGF